jgi:hypothetical protein
MDDPLVVGALFGAVVGVVHGGYVFRERASRPGVGAGVALYYAAWTFVLWVVFGSYVLALSLIAIPLYSLRGAARRMRGSTRLRASWT